MHRLVLVSVTTHPPALQLPLQSQVPPPPLHPMLLPSTSAAAPHQGSGVGLHQGAPNSNNNTELDLLLAVSGVMVLPLC
jgi:hypothetical protein